jgi:uncharacterized protein DUF6527
MHKASRLRDRGEVERRHEADALLESSGDFVIVKRGVLRSFVIRCPDGCGDTLTINLDPRSEKAWRFYRKRRQVSLFPSIWRDSGCGSHFIVWNHSILWCGRYWNDDDVPDDDISPDLGERILRSCTQRLRHFSDIAEELDEIPWDVSRECHALVAAGVIVEGEGQMRGCFGLRKTRV